MSETQEILRENLKWLKESWDFFWTKDELLDNLSTENLDNNEIYKSILEELNIRSHVDDSIKNLKTIMWNIENIDKTILEKLTDLLMRWNTENVELFFGKGWIIKTKDELNTLIANQKKWKEISEFLWAWNSENMKLFFEVYKIKNKKDLDEAMKDEKIWQKITDLIEDWKPENMELFIWKDWFVKEKNDLDTLIKGNEWEEIHNLIETWKANDVKSFFEKDIS